MNTELIKQFQILQAYYKQENDRGRTSAYSKAIIALKSYGKPINNIKQISAIKQVGPKMISKIDEFLRTGHIKAVEEIKPKIKPIQLSPMNTVLKLFQTVHGIGPKKAKILYDQGLRTIEDLQKNKHLLISSSRIALKYHQQLQKRVARDNITVFYIILLAVMNQTYGYGSYRLDIAGSYRRGAEDSGDVDCLVSTNKFTLVQLVQTLKKYKLIADVLDMRKEKFLGIGQCPSGNLKFRFDIEFVPENEFGSALLYFTGSKDFNRALRYQAKLLGLLLNEHGLFKNGVKVLSAPTEKDIFQYLGKDYIEPRNR